MAALRMLAGLARSPEGGSYSRADGDGGQATCIRSESSTEDRRMSKVKRKAEPATIVADDPEDRKGRLKFIGGSPSDHWNNVLANQAIDTHWITSSDPDAVDRQISAA